MKMLTATILIVGFLGTTMGARIARQADPEGTNPAENEADRKAILELIERESGAFWDKEYDTWASCWAHEPYIRTMGWWERGGVTVVKGWEERGPRTKQHMLENPDPNPQKVRRENINMRIYSDAAWVTFDQYGSDTGEPDMDMPGLSRETRFLEKQNGEWKIVYVGWLLEGHKK